MPLYVNTKESERFLNNDRTKKKKKKTLQL